MSDYKEVIEIFSKLWKKIDHPHSACPDVSLGDVFDQMVNIIAEDYNSKLSQSSRWVMSYVHLSECSGFSKPKPFDLSLSWAELTVPRTSSYEYKDEKTIRKEYSKMEKLKSKAMNEIEKAIDNLVSSGDLELVDGELRIPNV
jgi:hypothetical protein